MFYYVYVLKSENDGNNYVGYTNDLRARMNLHNAGKVLSTKNRLPIKLIYFEGCLNQQDATKREKYLKTAWGKRYIGNFYNAIEKQNRIARDHKPTEEDKAAFLCSMNSYLGIMKHYKSYKLRKRMIFKRLCGYWFNHVYLSGDIAKFVLKVRPAKRKQRNANTSFDEHAALSGRHVTKPNSYSSLRN